LFEQLGLPKTKKIKTGYSTDHAELEKIRDSHPIVEDLLAYREVAKLKTGFTDALLPLIDPKTGRIHTTFLQASAATGRLASTNPNIQNIPIRGDLGRQIRRAFIPEEGFVLLSADYEQIELRVLAHLSEDPGILEAFASGHDFHAAIASKVYGVGPEDVQSGMRAFAKQFSYGIAYGMSAYGVAERLHVETDEAAAFIEAYFGQFPKVREFLDDQVKQAKKDGFTTTMFGRRRYLPELGSSNFRVRAMGERMALNAPIQGTSADIIKKAMIDIDAKLRRDPALGRMLLSVHDELVFEIPADRVDEASATVRTLMEGVADLRCGLSVDIHTGENWSAAHA
jgi:DNA polymerase-1